MSDALPSVLVVTSELVGPFKNGGIGTATTGLVETLAGMGCRTTVLYTGAIWHVEIDMLPWIERYRAIGVELVAPSLADMRRLAGPVRDHGLGSAYLVYEFARSRCFDIIHVNDTLGEGLHLLAAQRLGTGFADSLTLIGLHSPTRWIMRLNRQKTGSLVQASFDAMERASVASADRLWGPSDYLIDEIRAGGWTLPPVVERRQYVMPTPALFAPIPPNSPAPTRCRRPLCGGSRRSSFSAGWRSARGCGSSAMRWTRCRAGWFRAGFRSRSSASRWCRTGRIPATGSVPGRRPGAFRGGSKPGSGSRRRFPISSARPASR